jgi:hypothetical protein
MLRKAMSVSDAKRALGFPPTSNPSPEEIHKAYKALAFQLHPDRGGDQEKMVEVNVARDVLEGKQRAAPEHGEHPSPGYAPQTYEKKQRAVDKKTVTWDEARTKAGVPTSGVEWKFRSQGMHESRDGETTNGGIHGYVVYGKSANHHIFVAVEHYRYDSLYENVEHDLWWMKKYEFPLTQKIRDLAPKILRKGFEDMPHLKRKYNAKIAILNEETHFVEKSIDGYSLNLHFVAFKDGMRMMGELDDNDPWVANRKLTVVISMGNKPGKWDEYQASLTINGKVYELRDESVAKMADKTKGRPIFWSIFGDYWHQGGKKTLTKMQLGQKILTWMVKFLQAEPEELKTQLQTAVDQMGAKK